jgi:hypothetical protein
MFERILDESRSIERHVMEPGAASGSHGPSGSAEGNEP